MFAWANAEELVQSATTATIHVPSCRHAPDGLDAIRLDGGGLTTSSVAPRPCRVCRPPVLSVSEDDLAAVAGPPRFRVYRDGVLIDATPEYDIEALYERLAAR